MKRRRGFAVIEFPLVLLIVGLVGLGLTAVLYVSTGRTAWFVLVPSGLLAILGAVLLFLYLKR